MLPANYYDHLWSPLVGNPNKRFHLCLFLELLSQENMHGNKNMVPPKILAALRESCQRVVPILMQAFNPKFKDGNLFLFAFLSQEEFNAILELAPKYYKLMTFI